MEGNDLQRKIDEFFIRDIIPSLKRKISDLDFHAPTYDLISHRICFAGVDIQIPYNSDQDLLCRTLFKDISAMRKEWSWDEVVEHWGERDKGWRAIYNAGREINGKVAAETTIKDLLLVRKLTIAVNPRFSKVG